MQLPSIPLLVLDTETTGFVPRVHKIIEFASVLLENGEVKDEYEELFYAKEIPPHVEVLTRIRTLDVQTKLAFEDKSDDVLAKIPANAIVVGQNVLFDLGMLKGSGIDLSDRPWIDTSMLASLVFPELESYSLGYLSEVLKLNHTPKHRALGDVRATIELLAKCWERLLELPPDMHKATLDIMQRSTPGYRALFAALPKTTAKKAPSWLGAKNGKWKMENGKSTPNPLLPTPSNTVSLLEEPLDSSFLDGVITTAIADKKNSYCIAVKNLEATVRQMPLAESGPSLRLVFPPYLLLDQAARDKFLTQETFTADEATLALKLAWYTPTKRNDFPLHAGEDAVWNGKVACTKESPAYQEQWKNLPSVLLLDHRQLLEAVAEEESKMPSGTHVVIDDASMLEDTATKAYGWFCDLDALRAAAEGKPVLTKFTDVLQLWIEKVRQFQDIRYLTVPDLNSQEAKGLRTQLQDLRKESLSDQVKKQLNDLGNILQTENIAHRISYIEQRQNGSQLLHSVPERIGELLTGTLYKTFPTTLLIPPGSANNLKEILPPGIKTEPSTSRAVTSNIPITISPDPPLESFFQNPPEGKTVILINSRGMIEDLFVKNFESLEARGIAMICQGLSGGQGRMRAEFLAAPAPALWLLTPWTFETVEMPADSIDHLIIRAVPFDHPSHAVLGRRAAHYTDAFNHYLLPRLLHRLFRLLRTFSKSKTENADVRLLDERIQSKQYGKIVKAYLESICEESAAAPKTPKKAAPATKSKPGQMTMF